MVLKHPVDNSNSKIKWCFQFRRVHIVKRLLTNGISFCLRKVSAFVISRSLPSSEYCDSFTLSMHQSKPTANEPSITGAISLAAVNIVLSACSFLSFSTFLRESSLIASIRSRCFGSSSYNIIVYSNRSHS